MNQLSDEIIVSSRKRPPLARRQEASRKSLLGTALLCSLLLAGESLFLRSELRLSFFSAFSIFDMAWYTLTLFLVTFSFSLLVPKIAQLVIIIVQLPLNIFILGSILSFHELPTLGLLRFVLNEPGLPELALQTAISSPFIAVPLLLFVLKAIVVLLMPPFQAKHRLPLGALLFMACCITLIPPQSATLGLFTSTRTPTYKIMAAQSIQRHGYIFTWLAEQHSQTWRDCYVPPATPLQPK